MELLRENIHAKLQSNPDPDPLAQRDTEKLSAEWADLSNCIMDAATASFGFSTKKHQDWFDDNNASIPELLSEKNAAHAAKLRNPSSTALHQKWIELRPRAQKELRQMENK